jgi:capsular polysaccharide biosynthesis protein
LIGDVSFSYTDKIVAPEQNNIFRQKYFTKPKVYKGVVFTMLAGGPSIVNYGHWMHDVLPRIYLLKKSGWFNKVDYFLVPSVRYDFQRDSLQLLGIAPEKIIDGEKNPHITAHTIIAATAPRGNDTLVPQWALDFLRQSYLTNISSHLNSPAHIYISRKDSRHRNVLNEETLMKVLGKYSFVSYQLSGLPFIEKVRLFATADVVITHTGAGLTNLIFCRPGTRILEIFSDKMVLGPFFDIAQRLNLDYQYLIARSVPNNKNRPQGLEDDIYVDLQQIQSLMHKIIHVNDEGKVTNRYNNSHRPS